MDSGSLSFYLVAIRLYRLSYGPFRKAAATLGTASEVS